MSDLKFEYTNRMYGDHGAYAAWFPISPVRLGDYGTVEGRLFTVVRVKAGLSVTFSTKYDFVLNLAGAYQERIADIPKVMRQLIACSRLSATDPKHWDASGWRLVTSVLRVKNLTVLMSAGNSSGVTLEAQGQVQSIQLADANLKLEITSGQISGQQWITRVAADDALFSPLFGMHRIKRFFSNYWFEDAGDRTDALPTTPAIGATVVPDGDLGAF